MMPTHNTAAMAWNLISAKKLMILQCCHNMKRQNINILLMHVGLILQPNVINIAVNLSNTNSSAHSKTPHYKTYAKTIILWLLIRVSTVTPVFLCVLCCFKAIKT